MAFTVPVEAFTCEGDLKQFERVLSPINRIFLTFGATEQSYELIPPSPRVIRNRV